MWQAISHLLSEQLGEGEIELRNELPGGEIHAAWHLRYAGRDLFVKCDERELLPIFTAEADQLELLSRSKEGRFENDAEREVLARHALPPVSALSPPGSLAYGHYRVSVGIAAAVGGLRIGRTARFQYRRLSPKHLICGKACRWLPRRSYRSARQGGPATGAPRSRSARNRGTTAASRLRGCRAGFRGRFRPCGSGFSRPSAII